MSNEVTQQIETALQNAITQQLNSLNLGVSNTQLSVIAQKVAKSFAGVITSSVFNTSNSQLDKIPKQLIGKKNPVDLITSNLDSNKLQNVLGNLLDTQLSKQLTDSIVSTVQTELKISIPPGKLTGVDFKNLTSSFAKTLTPTVSNTVTSALSSFTTSLFSGSRSSKSLLSSIENIFAELSADSEEALDRIDENFAQITSSKYLTKAAQFDVNNSDNQEKLQVLTTGFLDPSATYPTKEYNGRSDTNKLATGDVEGTIVQEKSKNRMLGAKLPGGESWDEPESAFKGEYPYNKVTETESGHIIEVDDTPGAERLHLFHRAGTYVEIDSNGSMVRRIKGSSYEIIDRNGKIAISGRADISINGACNIYVGNDANIEVDGDTNLTCHNDITAQAGGTLNLSAKEGVNISSSKINLEAYDTMNIRSNVLLALSAVDLFTMKANVDMMVKSKTLWLQSEQNTYEYTGNIKFSQIVNDLHVKSGGSTFLNSQGKTDIKSSGSVNIDGSTIQLNNNLSNDASDSQTNTANVAGISSIGVMSGRKDIVAIELSDPSPLTINDTLTLNLEEQGASEAEILANQDKLRTLGIASTSELEQVPVEQDKAEINSSQVIIVPGSKELLKVSSLPGNYNLSPNFTLEMLTNKAAVTKDSIETSELSYGQIVYNLQCVALNILEPVYNLYPNAFVTSGYRQRSKSSSTSQHPLGCAVDIQFKGASKKDYFDIAKRLAKVLKYDQLLLEFCAYTNNPWIHISYTDKTNRLQVMTFWNHKKHTDGLVQLA